MAFYHVRVRNILSNGKVVGWGFDLETPVPIDVADQKRVADAVTTEWKTNVALYCADQTLGQATIQEQQRIDNCPAQPPGTFVCLDGSQRFVREPTKPLVFSGVAGAAGTALGTSLPPQCALVVTFRTNAGGRRALGRCYTPPPPEGVTNDLGVVSDFALRETAVRETVEAAEGIFIPAIADRDHVVWSIRYNSQAEVVDYDANQRVDTQRRRLSR